MDLKKVTEQNRPANSSSNDVVLFVSHIWNESILQRFIDLKQSMAGFSDCFLVLDATNAEVLTRWERALAETAFNDSILPFTMQQIEARLGYSGLYPGTVTPGSAHFPLLGFWKERKYAYYWIVEYDVRVTMEWSRFFSHFRHSDADLMISHLTTYQKDPGWSWWRSLRLPEHAADGLKTRLPEFRKGFFPIYRVSEKALGIFDRAHQQKWRGHFEVLLPLIAQENDLKMEDLNNLGAFYRPGPLGPGDGGPPFSSLRWRPAVSDEELGEPGNVVIFHPVK